MSTLNVINKSPYEKHTLEQCLSRIADGDSVLLIEDATVAALNNTSVADSLKAAGGKHKLYVLAPDLAVRGLEDKPLVDGMSTIDFKGFVELVTTHDRVHSWL